MAGKLVVAVSAPAARLAVAKVLPMAVSKHTMVLTTIMSVVPGKRNATVISG